MKLNKLFVGVIASALAFGAVADSELNTRVYKVATEYKNNQFAAEHKYKGKNIKMTGLILSFEKSASGLPVAKFSNGSRATFLKSELEKVFTLKVKEYATVNCKVDKLVRSYLNFKHCKVLPFDNSQIERKNDWKLILGV